MKQLMKNHQSWLFQTLKKSTILMRDLVENLNFSGIENLKESIVLMKDNKTLSILVILNVVKKLWFS
jgi:hypothetical protein